MLFLFCPVLTKYINSTSCFSSALFAKTFMLEKMYFHKNVYQFKLILLFCLFCTDHFSYVIEPANTTACSLVYSTISLWNAQLGYSRKNITIESECKFAAILLGKTWLTANSTIPDAPPGCFVWDTKVLWNTHATGSSDPRFSPICKKTGDYI